MAVTKIWPIHGRIDQVLVYVENKDKTTGQVVVESFSPEEQALYDVCAYAMNDSKTEQRIYVSGINCEPDIAREQMMRTKNAYGKEDGIVAFHGYQSFRPGEVSAQLAHDIGIETAQEMWGDRFEVVVATHLNTGCYHNHFCINSVSVFDGYKYNEVNDEWKRMAEVSDRICLEHGLSIIENPKRGNTLPRDEYFARKNGEPAMNDIIRKDIDDCIAESFTIKMFYEKMESRGYAFDFTHKYATVKHRDFERPRRLKTLGTMYTRGAIEDRIFRKWIPERREDNFENTDKIFLEEYPDISYPRFQYVFFRYTWELKYARTHPWYNSRYLYLVKDDLKKLDQFSAETELIISNDIKSTADLDALIAERSGKADELIAARQKLRNKLKTAVANNDEAAVGELKDRISDYSIVLKNTRKEIKTAQRIKEDVENVAEKTEKIEQRNEEFENRKQKNQKERPAAEYMTR